MLKLFIIFAARMKPTTGIFKHFLRRKLVTAVLITASVAAFATLGEGGEKRVTHSKKLLSTKPNSFSYKTFTLKSAYQYRGSTVISKDHQAKYIMVNNVVSYQRGNTSYILPMKKKVLLDKVTFNPAPVRY